MGAQRWLSTAVAPMAVAPYHRCKGLALLRGSLTAQWWCTLHPGEGSRQLRMATATSCQPAAGRSPQRVTLHALCLTLVCLQSRQLQLPSHAVPADAMPAGATSRSLETHSAMSPSSQL